uniref:DNA-directed RNA polymerase subunit n=1 Tax=Pandorina morum TaxID=33099 RepID=A0A6C0RWD1_PANMO|nr:beta' subunit of RNA polymerase [Pandorina morum]
MNNLNKKRYNSCCCAAVTGTFLIRITASNAPHFNALREAEGVCGEATRRNLLLLRSSSRVELSFIQTKRCLHKVAASPKEVSDTKAIQVAAHTAAQQFVKKPSPYKRPPLNCRGIFFKKSAATAGPHQQQQVPSRLNLIREIITTNNISKPKLLKKSQQQQQKVPSNAPHEYALRKAEGVVGGVRSCIPEPGLLFLKKPQQPLKKVVGRVATIKQGQQTLYETQNQLPYIKRAEKLKKINKDYGFTPPAKRGAYLWLRHKTEPAAASLIKKGQQPEPAVLKIFLNKIYNQFPFRKQLQHTLFSHYVNNNSDAGGVLLYETAAAAQQQNVKPVTTKQSGLTKQANNRAHQYFDGFVYINSSMRKKPHNKYSMQLPQGQLLSSKDFQNKKVTYSKMLEISLITISLASANRIRQWAEKTLPNGKVVGEVLNPETVHYKTLKPIKGGLFCERIFGPLKDHECACGKKFNIKHYLAKLTTSNSQRDEPAAALNLSFFKQQSVSAIKHDDKAYKKRYFCRVCDVEYTYSIIRRTQLGYIKLASPTTHVWFVKGLPSYISILLDMKKTHLQNVIYNTETLTLEHALKSSNKNDMPLTPSSIFESWQKIMLLRNNAPEVGREKQRAVKPYLNKLLKNDSKIRLEIKTQESENKKKVANYTLNNSSYLFSDFLKKLTQKENIETENITAMPINIIKLRDGRLKTNFNVEPLAAAQEQEQTDENQQFYRLFKKEVSNFLKEPRRARYTNKKPSRKKAQSFFLNPPEASFFSNIYKENKKIFYSRKNNKTIENGSGLDFTLRSSSKEVIKTKLGHSAKTNVRNNQAFKPVAATQQQEINIKDLGRWGKTSFAAGLKKNFALDNVPTKWGRTAAQQQNVDLTRFKFAAPTVNFAWLAIFNSIIPYGESFLKKKPQDFKKLSCCCAAAGACVGETNTAFFFSCQPTLSCCIAAGKLKYNVPTSGGRTAAQQQNSFMPLTTPFPSTLVFGLTKKHSLLLWNIFKFSVDKLCLLLRSSSRLLFGCFSSFNNTLNIKTSLFKKVVFAIKPFLLQQQQLLQHNALREAEGVAGGVLVAKPQEGTFRIVWLLTSFLKLNNFNFFEKQATKLTLMFLLNLKNSCVCSESQKKTGFQHMPKIISIQKNNPAKSLVPDKKLALRCEKIKKTLLVFLKKANVTSPLRGDVLLHSSRKEPATTAAQQQQGSQQSAAAQQYLRNRRQRQKFEEIKTWNIKKQLKKLRKVDKHPNENLKIKLAQRLNAGFIYYLTQNLKKIKDQSDLSRQALKKGSHTNTPPAPYTLRGAFKSVMPNGVTKPSALFFLFAAKQQEARKSLFKLKLKKIQKTIRNTASCGFATYAPHEYALREAEGVVGGVRRTAFLFKKATAAAAQQQLEPAEIKKSLAANAAMKKVKQQLFSFLVKKKSVEHETDVNKLNLIYKQLRHVYNFSLVPAAAQQLQVPHSLLSKEFILLVYKPGSRSCTAEGLPKKIKNAPAAAQQQQQDGEAGFLFKKKLANYEKNLKAVTITDHKNQALQIVNYFTFLKTSKQLTHYFFFLNQNEKQIIYKLYNSLIIQFETTQNKTLKYLFFLKAFFYKKNLSRNRISNFLLLNKKTTNMLWLQKAALLEFKNTLRRNSIQANAAQQHQELIQPDLQGAKKLNGQQDIRITLQSEQINKNFVLLQTAFKKETAQNLFFPSPAAAAQQQQKVPSFGEATRSSKNSIWPAAAQQGQPVLVNNLYCISHRELWEQEKHWQDFAYYYYDYSQNIFKGVDIAIPNYKHRNYDILFAPLFVSNRDGTIYENNSTGSKIFKKLFNNGMNINTSFSGAGLIQKLLNEYDFNELKKIDKQNRIVLFEYNKYIKNLKKNIVPRKLKTGVSYKETSLWLTPQVSPKAKSKQIYYKACHIRDVLIRRTKLTRKILIFFESNTTSKQQNSVGRRGINTDTENSPASMILTLLPVLPPVLRPVLKMAGQFTISDLNRLYQRIIYRNERLKKFLKDPALNSSFEMKYAQRLLQEAVDNLIQNGKSGVVSEKDTRGRLLKSLSDILKGKQGRFRQYLLGKRVDYSGRSVIVVGPQLKLYECGIPKEMALVLYSPFLIKRILNEKLADTYLSAKKIIKTNPLLVSQLLREIMKSCPVLLNRAPTLHRLGFQAFQPKLIDGKAILLHPLVCPAFNADFDGDQMAVHVPITVEARAEAWKLMLARTNLLSPATGEPLILPSQDMVLGCYYLTTNSTGSRFCAPAGLKKSFSSNGCKAAYFNNITDVLKAYSQKLINIHTIIWVNIDANIENGQILEQPLEIRVPLKRYKLSKPQKILNKKDQTQAELKQITQKQVNAPAAAQQQELKIKDSFLLLRSSYRFKQNNQVFVMKKAFYDLNYIEIYPKSHNIVSCKQTISFHPAAAKQQKVPCCGEATTSYIPAAAQQRKVPSLHQTPTGVGHFLKEESKLLAYDSFVKNRIQQNQGSRIKQIIRTTPGKILFNVMIKNAIEKQPAAAALFL